MTDCTNCGSPDLRWFVDKRGPSDVTDGRLRMSEIHVIAVLGCENCMETLMVIEEDAVNDLLNTKL